MDQRVAFPKSRPGPSPSRSPAEQAMLGVLADCGELLSRPRNPRDAMGEIMARLGPALDADRVNYFVHDVVGRSSTCLSSWRREGIPAIEPGPFPDDDFREVIEPLSRGEIYGSALAVKTGKNLELNASSGTTADLMVPVIVRGQLRGMLNIDQCRGQPDFPARQVDTLRALAAMIASAIGRYEAESARSREQRQQHLAREAAIASAADVVRELLSNDDFGLAIARVLPIIGAMAACQRVVLLMRDQSDGRPCHRLVEEWVAENQPSQAEHGMAVIFDEDVPPGVIQALMAGSAFWWRTSGRIDDFSLRHQAMGVVLTGALPLLVEGRYVGTLAYDWCFEPELGADGVEFRVLQLAANAMAAALQRKRAIERQIEQERALAASRLDYQSRLTSELAVVNDALARSIEGLAKLDKLEPFLVELLQHASRASGAQGGAVVLLEPDGARQLVVVGRDRVLSGPALVERDMHFVPWDEGTSALVELTGDSDEPILMDPCSPQIRESFRRFHAEEGNHLVVMVPMRIGRRLVGWTGLGFRESRLDPDRDVNLLRVLSRQMTMAIELVRLAEAEHEARLVAERRQAETARREQIERAHAAMQAGVDALHSLSDADGYLGTVLRLAARAFDARATWYFDVDSEAERLRLRMWQAQDHVHAAWDTTPVPEALRDTHSRLVEGFTVPREHLGMDPFQRTRAALIDHRMHSVDPELTRYVLTLGAPLELNVPVLVDGRPHGALVIHRDDPEFTLEDVALAETLCKQIALALRAGSIAGLERDQAVALDRMATLTRMAIDLRATNRALGRSMARLSGFGELDSFLRQMLHEVMEVSDAPAGAVVLLDEEGANHRLIVDPRGELDERTKIAEDVRMAAWSPRLEAIVTALARVETHLRIPTGETGFPAFDRFHARLGAEVVVLLPMRISETLIGWIGLCFTRERPLSEERAMLLAVLAQQTALAIELDRLHRELGEAEARREQDRLERMKIEHREKSRRALQQLVDSLHSLEDRDESIRHALEVCSEAFGASGCSYFEVVSGTRRVRLHSIFARGRHLIGAYGGLADEDRAVLVSLSTEGRDVPESPGRPDLFDQARPFVVSRRPGDGIPCPSREIGFLPDGLDLNVPVLVQGEVAGFLGIYRKGSDAYSSDEIALAESIGKHLALALRASAVAQRERMEAVEGEQARHAQHRADQLEAANGVLRAINARLGDGGDPAAALQAILEQATRALGARAGAMLQETGDGLRVVARIDPMPTPAPAVAGTPAIRPAAPGRPDVARVSWRPASDADGDGVWRSAGLDAVLEAEIFDGDRAAGLLLLGFAGLPTQRESMEWLADAICQQSALAMRLASLSSEVESRARRETLLAERARMAREIHDGVAQGFTGILMQLGALGEADHDPAEARELARRAAGLARQGLADARRAVLALQPEGTSREDLVSALAHLVEASGVPGKIDCGFRSQGSGFDAWLGPARAHDLYRVVQEALNNALRHALARRIDVILERTASGIRLQVEDDGVGFVEGGSDGFGISNMRARVQAMGGSLRIDSAPGAGTRLVVDMPPLD